MNQRIRYQKTRSGILTSRRNFTTSAGQTVSVELNLNDKKYRIVDATTGAEVATGGNTRNVSVLKIQAKKGLVNLGVEFAEETRNRGVVLASGNNLSAAGR